MKKKTIKTGNKEINKLYEAVIDYIEKRNGTVAVIGGIVLVDEGDAKYNYGLMVRITGKKPIFNQKTI